jgi:hypothetical protein
MTSGFVNNIAISYRKDVVFRGMDGVLACVRYEYETTKPRKKTTLDALQTLVIKGTEELVNHNALVASRRQLIHILG